MSAGLNLAQLRAVHYTEGPCLVLAGAGSGKTRVITHKIAHMIERGMEPKAIAAISLWKNLGLNGAQALAQAKDDHERSIAVLMQRYEERLTAYQSVDFDDLIGLPLKLLRDFPEVREKWQRQLGHVLVDEYQDTNATQYELLKLLVGTRGHFTAVGDDDQSIYGWRGATLDNLKKLPMDYPQLQVIKLEQNYRSTSAILRAANNVIGPNPKLYPKTLFSELGEGEPVRVVDADSEEHEAERAVARIQSLRAAANPPPDWKSFAILYRANHQAKPFEKALRRANIPYKVSGGTSFFDRAEIRDLCAWFRLWINQDDDPAQAKPFCCPVLTHAARRPAAPRARWPARVWPLCERPGIPRTAHTGAGCRPRLPGRLAERDRLRKAPVRRRRQREGGRCTLDQRTGVL